MIFNVLLTIVLGLINLIFSWLPALPQVPTEFSSAISNFFDLIFQNSGIVSFFLPMALVKIALPIVLVLVNFKYIYHISMWILRKLPWSVD